MIAIDRLNSINFVSDFSKCDCKFPTDRHPELTTMRRGENWSSDMHTAMEPCTSYGSYKSHKLGKSEVGT